jgi:hypothetical protein
LKNKNILSDFFDDGSVDLSTENETYIDLDDPHAAEEQKEPKWSTSVHVPEQAKEVLTKIDYTIAQKKLKSINKGNKWFYGILLLDFLLDHMDFGSIRPDENVYEFITKTLKKKLEG